jgi:hypothetical protein
MRDDHKILEKLEWLTNEIERLEHENRRQFDVLARLLWHLINPNRFTIRITQEGTTMAIGSLTSPGTASILLALLDNGAPYVAPEGSTYVFTPSLACSDASVTIAPDATTPDQFDVTIPAGDTSTSAVFTATATAPDGTTATGTLSIPLAAIPQQFSISVTQTA